MANERRTLIARVSPVDYDAIHERAKTEQRTIGEVVAILMLESELLAEKRREVARGR